MNNLQIWCTGKKMTNERFLKQMRKSICELGSPGISGGLIYGSVYISSLHNEEAHLAPDVQVFVCTKRANE